MDLQHRYLQNDHRVWFIRASIKSRSYALISSGSEVDPVTSLPRPLVGIPYEEIREEEERMERKRSEEREREGRGKRGV